MKPILTILEIICLLWSYVGFFAWIKSIVDDDFEKMTKTRQYFATIISGPIVWVVFILSLGVPLYKKFYNKFYV